VLGWVSANDQVDLLAKFGFTLLLFVVGLKLDLHIIRTMGSVALATGLGKVVFTSVIGYLIALAFGITPVATLYVAIALTFSSTIIIVKLLSEQTRSGYPVRMHCPGLSNCAGPGCCAGHDRHQRPG
jgi:Kef-type K+ transport system membrane component KefB